MCHKGEKVFLFFILGVLLYLQTCRTLTSSLRRPDILTGEQGARSFQGSPWDTLQVLATIKLNL